MIRAYLFIITAVLFGTTLVSCAQTIVYREFYEPNEQTMLKRNDGSSVGAVRVEATKNGVPNWSDNKSLSISFMGL